MMKKYILFAFLLFLSGCGISEDCIKNAGNPVTKEFVISDFDKIRIHAGISLVVKEGQDFKVIIQSGTNIIDNIEVNKEGDFLVIKDNSTCNWTRDFKAAIIYVTAPNISEIHSKTEQDIYSDGTLTFPILRLFALNEAEAGTGDFYFNINNAQTVIESNHVSNFYISGNTAELLCNFYFGTGKFYGENFICQNIKIFQRGSNDMILKPMQSISGKILNTGNVILKNNPPIINVEQLFSGHLIMN
jgi:hypothetical protein